MQRVWFERTETMSQDKYTPPKEVHATSVAKLLAGVRSIPLGQGARLALPGFGEESEDPLVYFSGDASLVRRRAVAIVGSRKVSDRGSRHAAELAAELVGAGVVVVSGLAEGVDAAAHRAAIAAGGRTVAVIGTPLEKAYPAKHASLQERIYREHLLVTPFPRGSRVFPSNFPQRNKLMAALSDATIIIEANDDSGSLHQAAECAPRRLNRWLFIARSILERRDVTWPARFLNAQNAKVRILDKVDDVLAVL